MLLFDGVGGLIVLGVWIFCFIDVLLTPPELCRNLPKVAWVLLVLIFDILGSIAWLVAGRPWNRAAVGASPRSTHVDSRYPEYDRPNRYRPTNPDDDEEFLAGLRKRAEEQRRRAREQSREQGEPEQGSDPTS